MLTAWVEDSRLGDQGVELEGWRAGAKGWRATVEVWRDRVKVQRDRGGGEAVPRWV